MWDMCSLLRAEPDVFLVVIRGRRGGGFTAVHLGKMKHCVHALLPLYSRRSCPLTLCFLLSFFCSSNQHLVIANTVAACEAYVLAGRLGLRDTVKLRDLLQASWGHRQEVLQWVLALKTLTLLWDFFQTVF